MTAARVTRSGAGRGNEDYQQGDFSRWQGEMVLAGSPPLGIHRHVRPAVRAGHADHYLSPRPEPGLQLRKAFK
jgi:hypothetical protein